jgi:prepilin-type N-terminal cleavage/methylation domain-containing protein
MIRNNKGFTLVELMVVIVIIGVLAALAIPKFMDASTKAKISEVPTVLASYDHAQVAYIAENGAPDVVAKLAFTTPTSKWFVYADGNNPGEYTATTGKVSVGPIDPNTLTATTAVTVESGKSDPKIAHTINSDVAKKYIPNFE